MKILVGFNGGEVGRMALSLARDFAQTNNAFVHVITSMEGGSSEKQSDIIEAEKGLEFAIRLMEYSGIECDAQQSVRGLSAGEDLVKFAHDNSVNQIFVGVKRRSKVGKLLMGSTAQYVILNAPCPVMTIK